MTPTPEAIIGLELQGKGLDDANRKLGEHVTGWQSAEKHATGVADAFDRIAGRAAGVAGVAGIGVMLNDLRQLETVASRAALAVDVVTGRAGYRPYQQALAGVQAATGISAVATGNALGGIQSTIGGTFLRNPGQWGPSGLGGGLADYSHAFGIDVSTLGAYGQSMLTYGGSGAGSLGPMLDIIAAQSRAKGRSGQTAQMTEAIAAVITQLGQAHGQMVPGSTGLGAMYQAAGAGNRSFYDPGMFAVGVAGVDSTLSGAYANPRMQAALQMAGISYKWQREGLGGEHGQQMAHRLLRWSDTMYGKGTTEQDVFLRSQFGDVSASMLEALSSGRKTWDQLQHTTGTRQGHITRSRSRADQQTLDTIQNKTRADLLGHVSGPLQWIESHFDHHPVEKIIGLIGAGKLLKSGLPKLFRAFGKGGARSAAAAAAAAAAAGAPEEAAAAGSVLLGPDGRPIAEADRAAARATTEAAARSAARTSRIIGMAGKVAKVAPILDAAGFLLDPGNLSPDDMMMDPRNPAARARQRALNRRDAKGVGAIVGAHVLFHNGAGDDDVEKFHKSVTLFEQIIKGVLGNGGRGTTAFAGYTPGSGMDAAGLQGTPSAQLGSNMVLASLLTGNRSSGGGQAARASLASYPISGGMTGAADGGAPCTLTYYAPSRGGINGSSGGGAAGVPLTDGSWGCAAPSNYSFGTIIRFSYNGKSIDVPVLDRGSAITGSHFDLLVAPAKALGMYSAGKVNARFKVVGHKQVGKAGADGNAPGTAGSGSSGGSSAMSSRTISSWSGQAPAAPGGASGAGGRAGDLVVNIDGRQVERTRRLVRGRA